MSDVGAWLRRLALERYAKAFADNDIDWTLLSALDHELLKEIGVSSVGHRMRILEASARLAERASDTDREERSVAPEAMVERRQLTVMFCDLVGSTRLSQQIDPEELSVLMKDYQDACARAVARYDGYVARYMGDGVLAYFGYPQAHEDDPERAIRAGFAIIRSTRENGGNSVRIGIATGLVVVGDLIGEASSQERAVVGETPNLAARLQAVAGPDQIVVSASTRRRAGGHFRFEDLGQCYFKGLDAPVRVYRAEVEIAAESRFAASHQETLSPLVGRDEEMTALVRRWDLAQSGDGQIALLRGEPGIGKSRLCEALSELVVEQPHTRCRYQCSPHHTDSAFHPVVEQLQRASGITAGDSPADRLARLRGLLERAKEPVAQDLSLITGLLSIDSADIEQASSLPPDQRRAATIAALIRQLQALAERGPVLMVFEDVHWIDPSSRELLDQLVARLPVLMLVTCRPEFEQMWSGHAHVITLALTRLARGPARDLARAVVGSGELSPERVAHIVEHTDGVPLFVEEFTRTVVEASAAADEGGEALMAFEVPPTLQDSLMARLDRLSTGKAVAQTASVIGREFELSLLLSISDGSREAVEAGVAELLASGLIARRSAPGPRYQFKHALIQDAACESLLKTRRTELHARTAQVMAGEFQDQGQTEPELVAFHYHSAGEYIEAVGWWRRAAAKASARAATAESVRHLQRAVAAIERCGADFDLQESVDTRLELVAALRVGEHIDEAFAVLDAVNQIAIANGLGSVRARVHYLRGNLNFPKGRVHDCLREHHQALDLARQCGSVELEAAALGGLADADYARGHMISAGRKFAACAKLARTHDLARLEAPNLAMQGIVGLYSLDIQGGLGLVEEALQMAEALEDPRTLAMARSCQAILLPEIGRLDAAEAACEELADLAGKLGAWRFDLVRRQVLAQVDLVRGNRSEAERLLEDALDLYDRVPESFDKPRTLALLALASDQPQRRRSLLAEGEVVIARGCLAHGALAFYRDAIDTCLELSDPDGADRYARALRQFPRDESLPYSRFHSARGAALAAVARGSADPELRACLAGLRDQALAAGVVRYVPPIEQGLQRVGG